MTIYHELCPLHTQRNLLCHPGKAVTSKISKNQQISTPSRPCTVSEIQATISSTKISISFQLPPPDSSTKSASASSFHHQAAAPHQPTSSKASSQSAVNFTSLPHLYHGSQVCCCLDIL